MSRKDLFDSRLTRDFIFRRRGVYDRALRFKRAGFALGICPPIAGEIGAGVESSTTRKTILVIVRRNIGVFTIWPYSAIAAEEYGRISAYLKSVGRPIQRIDMPPVAVALTLGDCTVFTNDSDLAAVRGLTLESGTP